jgi:hypothetical protein
VNNEFERIWKKVLMTYSRCYPVICLEELRKTTKYFRIADVQIENLLNTRLE